MLKDLSNSPLGAVLDVTGLSREGIHAKIAALPESESVTLLGGYDLIPAFILLNPSRSAETQGGDKDVPTDAPYGGAVGNQAQQFAPTRPVSRIPDSRSADSGDFVALLSSIRPTTPTPAGAFHEAAAEFAQPARDVASFLETSPNVLLSPTLTEEDPKVLGGLVGKGRVHILLHGANFAPEWGQLFGHAENADEWPVGLSAPRIVALGLVGSVVTFSSCYAAMIDLDATGHPSRDAHNQVALAALRAGAKAVFACTRSNWIDITSGDLLGPGLMKRIWQGLKAGSTAGESLVAAKRALLKAAMTTGASLDLPYVYKTVAQAQLYGHPECRL
jgi:hypothetical protein